MANRASITVGNYTYSAQDAKKTIDNIATLWSHFSHESHVPDGWLAGTRGFIAEMSSLGGISLPRLDDVDAAMSELSAALSKKYAHFEKAQIESLLAALWRFLPTMRMLNEHHVGLVAHLHASKGLPKNPIDVAEIGWRGVEGDVQRARAHHGRPWQALCIWSTDAIEVLRHEGHPISPGFAGENLTISGIPATSFRPGAHFRCGDVHGFLTAYAIPCRQNKDWFINHDFHRIHHDRGPHSRVYAMVTRTGNVSVGDTFELFTDR